MTARKDERDPLQREPTLPLEERVRIFNLGTPTERHRDTYELVNDLWRELEKLSVHHVALAAEQKREGGSSTAAHTPGLPEQLRKGTTFLGYNMDPLAREAADEIERLRAERKEDIQREIAALKELLSAADAYGREVSADEQMRFGMAFANALAVLRATSPKEPQR